MITRKLLLGTLASACINVVFDILFIAAALAAAALFSGAALMDPLNQGEKVEAIWAGLTPVIIFHALLLPTANIGIGLISAMLTRAAEPDGIYLRAAFLSLLVQSVLIIVIGIALFLIFWNRFFIGYAIAFAIGMTVVAPLRGIVVIAIAKRKK